MLAEGWPDLVGELVLGAHVERRGWFQREALQMLVHQQRRQNSYTRDYLLWTLMIIELWLRMSIDGTLHPSDSL
jgi:hypothetical protein